MINNDFRFLDNGYVIPTTEGGYADQPSVVALSDGTIVCCVTTGSPVEGESGTYLAVLRSFDGGKSWTTPVPIDDPAWESSYGALVLDKNERVYCFYDANLDHYVNGECGFRRIDMGGHFCMRYSDDFGVNWSERREIDVRFTDIDTRYPFIFIEGKQYRWFWNVARPFFDGDDLYITVAKPYMPFFLNEKPEKIFETARGVLLVAKGLANDPEAPFVTLPEGDMEMMPYPGDDLCEEHCCVKLSDGTLFIISRSEKGHPVCFISRDGGKTFSKAFLPEHIGGLPVKHPRAANFIWKLGEGKFVYWFHNAGPAPSESYYYRNPAWLCPCFEVDTPEGKTLAFGQPEIFLYHPSKHVGFSYPDMLYHDGIYKVTETQKRVARIHFIPNNFMDRILAQNTLTQKLEGLDMETLQKEGYPEQVYVNVTHDDPEDRSSKQENGGNAWIIEGTFEKGDVILDAYDRNVGGFFAQVGEDGTIVVRAGGSASNFTLEGSINVCDGKKHHIAWVIDAQAQISFLVIDGNFDNGGEKAFVGYTRFSSSLSKIYPRSSVALGENVTRATFVPRAIMTTEAVADYRASEILK